MNKSILGVVAAVIIIAIGGYIVLQHHTLTPSWGLPVPTTDTQQNSSSGSSQTPTLQIPGTQTGTTTSGPSSNPVAVAGMQQYTDAAFGFSFWYPSTWSVIANPPLQYAPELSGGTVVKSIVLGPPQDPGDGITITEFASAGRTITDNTNPGPVDDTAHVIRYYFDITTHTWMKENYPTSTAQSGTITAADISVNSMGGLHLFQGNARFGNDLIIPLSASHFVVVSGTAPGGIRENFLANTVVASDPSVATPVSRAEQIQTIQAEKNEYTGTL